MMWIRFVSVMSAKAEQPSLIKKSEAGSGTGWLWADDLFVHQNFNDSVTGFLHPLDSRFPIGCP